MNFFIFGHFRKSGEIVFDNLEGVLIENSKEFINLTNLFNGNQFMEKAGNSIINTSGKNLIRSAMQNTINAATKLIRAIFDDIFSNSSKSEFEFLFPETVYNDNIDQKKQLKKISSSNNYHQFDLNIKISNLQCQVNIVFILLIIIILVFIIKSFKRCYNSDLSSMKTISKNDPTSNLPLENHEKDQIDQTIKLI